MTRETGTARLVFGTAEEPVLAAPARGTAGLEGGGIIDRNDTATAVGFEVGRAGLVMTSVRGLAEAVSRWALIISAGCMALRVLSF